MSIRIILIVVFIAGVTTGWVGNTWFASTQLEPVSTVASEDHNAVMSSPGVLTDPSQATTLTSPDTERDVSSDLNSKSTNNSVVSEDSASGINVIPYFQELLRDRLYNDAMSFYQEQSQRNGQTAIKLKGAAIDHLRLLSETRNNNDFSEFIDSYLSIYYDDIEVLLLLADFNQANGSFLEAVDVYLLAKTYAYTEIDQQNTFARFNDFVERTDSMYTTQKNWFSLVNFYSHINTAGLMTSTHQYRLALAHLGNGDEYTAIEQLKQLVSDGTVGESAAKALNNLTNNKEITVSTNKTLEKNFENIALQKRGNQYLVDLTINRQDEVKLLIDTGASITALSRASFNSLTTFGEIAELDRRVFRTAGGVVMGTVYSVPELSLGPYSMRDTKIAVLDYDTNGSIDGLLGMNVLGQFRFQIDQENASLLLSKK